MKGVAGSQCTCGTSVVPARARCPSCASPMIETSFEGVGKVVASTAIHFPPKGFEKGGIVALVELDSGPRCIVKAPSVGLPTIGARVAVVEESGLLVLRT